MRRAVLSVVSIGSAAAALVGAGTLSVFNDTATGSGTLKTGTVALSLSGAKTASLPVNPTCTLPFTSAIGQRDNLGTANNTDCTASVSVSNAGSLPFTLAGAGTSVTDSSVNGVSCWTSTITDGATTGQVVLPGASQVVKLKTANTNDVAVCQGKTDNVTLNLTATEALGDVAEGFESGAPGWSVVGSAGWAIGVPTSGPGAAFRGSKVAATVLGGNYANNVDGSLVSPPVSLSASASTASVSFRSWFVAETYYDCGTIELTTNGGASWARVTPVGGYPYNGTSYLPGCESSFSGQVDGWAPYSVDLTSFRGQTVQLRWRLRTDSSVVFPGWYVDDVAFPVS